MSTLRALVERLLEALLGAPSPAWEPEPEEGEEPAPFVAWADLRDLATETLPAV